MGRNRITTLLVQQRRLSSLSSSAAHHALQPHHQFGVGRAQVKTPVDLLMPSIYVAAPFTAKQLRHAFSLAGCHRCAAVRLAPLVFTSSSLWPPRDLTAVWQNHGGAHFRHRRSSLRIASLIKVSAAQVPALHRTVFRRRRGCRIDLRAGVFREFTAANEPMALDKLPFSSSGGVPFHRKKQYLSTLCLIPHCGCHYVVSSFELGVRETAKSASSNSTGCAKAKR